MYGTRERIMSIFHLILIKPSHYDDDGYVIQWWRSGIPSNTLAILYAMVREAGERKVLGEDVEIRITTIDETNSHIGVDRLADMIEHDGGQGLVALVGVQTNQFPRSVDIARQFHQRDIQVCIGGFHVNGILSMLPTITPEIQEVLDLGIWIYAGESEGRFDEVLEDASRRSLKPIYNDLSDLPSVEGAVPPYMPRTLAERSVGTLSSFDAGRHPP